VGSSAVGGGDSILVEIVTLAMGAQSLRHDVPGSVVGVGEGMQEGRSSNEGESSGGEGRNEMEDGATSTNPQAESEEIPTKAYRQSSIDTPSSSLDVIPVVN